MPTQISKVNTGQPVADPVQAPVTSRDEFKARILEELSLAKATINTPRNSADSMTPEQKRIQNFKSLVASAEAVKKARSTTSA